MKNTKIILIVLLSMLFCTYVTAQRTTSDSTAQSFFNKLPKPKVFIDCAMCDMNYLTITLDYLDFVRDPKHADVHILIRTQITGSGGRQHELEFFGKQDLENIYNKFSFSTPSTNSVSENRDDLVLNLRQGLILYRAKFYEKIRHLWDPKLMADNKKDDTSGEINSIIKDADPWNKWVFNIGVNGFLSGQESSKSSNFGGNLSAKQVTEKNKLFIRGSYNFSESVFTFNDTDIISTEKTTALTVSDAISITDHWSAGAFSEFGSSTYQNQDFYVSLKPAIEYNFFDYAESTKKQLTISYRIGGIKYKYAEKTIFNKDEEFLWEHSLNFGGNVNQKWGRVSGEISYESYLNDSALHAFRFYLSTSIRIISGLSFNLRGNYSITNNQINLAGGDLSLEELLLKQQQVQSGYNFNLSIGLNFQFGSLFSSIVNPRFDF